MSTLNVSNITDGTDTVETSYVVNGVPRIHLQYSHYANTINQSIGVSSVTDVSTGQYNINFSNSFNDAYYRISGSTDNAYVFGSSTSSPPTTDDLRILVYLGAYYDAQWNSILCTGDLA